MKNNDINTSDALKEQYINIFSSLILRTESEVVEFKRAENSFDFDDLGKYFSALSNEANLRGLEFAWLIFGYDEKKHAVVGTSFNRSPQEHFGRFT